MFIEVHPAYFIKAKMAEVRTKAKAKNCGVGGDRDRQNGG